MKKLATLVATLLFATSSLSPVIASEIAAQAAEAEIAQMLKQKHVKDEVLVVYRDDAAIEEDLEPGQSHKIIKTEDVAATLAELRNDPNVLFAEPNYIIKVDAWSSTTTRVTPNDYGAGLNWYFEKSNLPEAWKKIGCPSSAACLGSNSVVVAVIDTGVAYEDYDNTTGAAGGVFKKSPDLDISDIWVNTKEIPNDGKDNDCNGYIDDYNGIDAYARTQRTIKACSDGKPLGGFATSYRKEGHGVDSYGHGTFVSAIIAANTDNTVGSPALIPNVKIMPIAANYTFTGGLSMSAIVNGIRYAADHGADVINMSFGMYSPSDIMKNAVAYAHKKGVLTVSSSGNGGGNTAHFPSDYADFSVGALKANDTRASYSTYGYGLDLTAYVGDGADTSNVRAVTLACMPSCTASTVDDGFSTDIGIGTSYASPQVAGFAALLKSFDPRLTRTELRQIIIESTRDVGVAGFDSLTGHGVIDFEAGVDAYNAVMKLKKDSGAPMYRFFHRAKGFHFYTVNRSERDKLIKYYSRVYKYEGIAYYAYKTDIAGDKTVPVYRIYNRNTGAHIYTTSLSEVDKIRRTIPNTKYEGVAFYAYNPIETFTTPVYRFYNRKNGSHFYTISQSEKNKVITTLSGTYKYEGTPFFVFGK